jgi:hypothetical protein
VPASVDAQNRRHAKTAPPAPRFMQTPASAVLYRSGNASDGTGVVVRDTDGRSKRRGGKGERGGSQEASGSFGAKRSDPDDPGTATSPPS